MAIAAVSAVLASGYAFTLTRSVWAWAACVAVLFMLGVAARRTAWLRLPALAWLAGLACTVLGVLVLALLQWAS